MKNKILSYILGLVCAVLLGFWGILWNFVEARECWDVCNWIKLNTCFPILKDCIEMKAEGTNPTNAFPAMLWVLTKIIMSVILVVCFILIIVAGIMRAWAWEDSSKTKKAKDLIIKVAVTIILLWFSGVILKLVNPNFFS